MIWESYPWRRELLRRAALIEKRKHQKRWHEASFAALEMDLMLGAYIVRKLIDAKTKVPNEVSSARIQAVRHPLRIATEIPNLMNWHHLDRFFDFTNGQQTSLSVVEFCNLVIHSWVFASTTDEDAGNRGFAGILVTSDRKRTDGLYSINVDDIIHLFREVGTRVVTQLVMARDDTHEWVVTEASDSQTSTTDSSEMRDSEAEGVTVEVTLMPSDPP